MLYINTHMYTKILIIDGKYKNTLHLYGSEKKKKKTKHNRCLTCTNKRMRLKGAKTEKGNLIQFCNPFSW